MKAELNYATAGKGSPVLTLRRETYAKRAVVDIPLTPEQAKLIQLSGVTTI